MSLILDDPNTKPRGLAVKTHGASRLNNTVFFSHPGAEWMEISLTDFLAAAHYVLTNADLGPDDPRRQFVECVQKMREVPGYNQNETRLETDIRPVISKK